MSTETNVEQVKLTLDGEVVSANKGELLIAAAERNGVYIPRFCWHPRMAAVGMCRQCLVEQDGPRGKMLVVSCMTTVADGMVIDTKSDNVKRAQEGVLELLLINHPLDCPVCDKGGECPLQDQAVSHGPGESRYVEEKRHYEKPLPISDLVFLDRERCILCDRCTRFAKDVAGDPLIHFTSRGNQTQVLTFPDEPFASYFSGNTVQICPVGALTASPYRFKARPWDLDQSESTCTTCSVGCRVTVQSSRDELLRYQGVDADGVNWGWLCDRGRFDFEAVNSDQRLSGPLVRVGDKLEGASWVTALDKVAAAVKAALASDGPGSIAVIGGARGTNEDAFAWAKLAKAVIGTPHTDAQLDDGLPTDVLFGLPRATIDQAAAATTVLLLGPDIKEELPVLYLRLRDSATKGKTRIIEVSSKSSGLTPYTSASLRVRPGEQAAAVKAILGNGSASAVGLDDADVTKVREQLGKGPVVVVLGRSNLSESGAFLADAAATLHRALPDARFVTALRRGNVFGALDAGLTPGLLPGRTTAASAELTQEWGASIASGNAMGTRQILEAAASGKIKVLFLLGADPIGDVPDVDLARRALGGAGMVVSIDTHPNESVKRAHVVLAAAAYAEKAGTTTNLEGRVSVLSKKVNGPGSARADWAIAADLADRLGADLGFGGVEDVWMEMRKVSPAHRDLSSAAFRANPDGVVVDGGLIAPPEPSNSELPKADAYRMRLITSRKLYDAAVGTAFSTSLSGLAPTPSAHLNPSDFARLATASGTQVKLVGERSTVVLPAISDPGVVRGAVWVGFHLPGAAIGELIDSSHEVTDVRVESL